MLTDTLLKNRVMWFVSRNYEAVDTRSGWWPAKSSLGSGLKPKQRIKGWALGRIRVDRKLPIPHFGATVKPP